jgi:hypothetical protein
MGLFDFNRDAAQRLCRFPSVGFDDVLGHRMLDDTVDFAEPAPHAGFLPEHNLFHRYLSCFSREFPSSPLS